MNKYWAHIVTSDEEEWEGDVIRASEVEAALKEKDEIIRGLLDLIKGDTVNHEIIKKRWQSTGTAVGESGEKNKYGKPEPPKPGYAD